MGRISNSNNPSDSLAGTVGSSTENNFKKESVRLGKHEQRVRRRQRSKRRLARVLTLVRLLPLITAPFMLLAGSKLASSIQAAPQSLKEPKKFIHPHDTLAKDSEGCYGFVYEENSAYYTQSKN